MHWKRTTITIVSEWQRQLAYSLESGQRILFDLGMSNHALHGLFSIMAVHLMADRVENASSTASPHFAVGGSSSLWLYVFIQERPMLLQAFADEESTDFEQLSEKPNKIHEEQEGIIIAYTGADIVTHMTSLTTLDSPTGLDISHIPTHQNSGVPISLRWLFFPMSNSSTITPWQSLPFVLFDMNRMCQSSEQFHHSSESNQSKVLSRFAAMDNGVSEKREEDDEHERAITITTIGLVIALVISAMFM